MIFTSFNFLIFFPIVIAIYNLLPVKLRWRFLLLASYYFYINIKPIYALLLAAVTLITYLFTVLIDKTKSQKKRKLLFIINIILTLLPLFFFKYYNFINNGIFHLLDHAGIRWPMPEISLMLPIGISYYTFMALGYTIDVYNEEIKAEKNFGIVALFLSFFPTVLSGPIERATNMFHQFRGKLNFNYDKIVKGFQFMLWGYFMKLVIADRIAILVHLVYTHIDQLSGSSFLMAVLLYPVEVYADLGGYSLIAIGMAQVMGIDVMQNFNRPFFAKSMSEFWRRWHISLISWLTNYIYTPLVFNLREYKMTGIVIAIMLTFIISGIWHDASMAFIIWGFIQGTFLSVEAITAKSRKNFIKRHNLNTKGWFTFVSCAFIYLLFAFSEIFGGALNSVNDALTVINKIFTNFSGSVYYDNPSMIAFLLFGIASLFFVEYRMEYYDKGLPFFNSKSRLVRNLAYAFLIIIILLIGVFDGGQFIYFKF